jgi:hypothetical protein
MNDPHYLWRGGMDNPDRLGWWGMDNSYPRHTDD